MSKYVKIQYRGIDFELNLIDRITILQGNSGTGKTLLHKAIENERNLLGEKSVVDYVDPRILKNPDKFRDFIKNIKDKIIIIDKTELGFPIEVREEINADLDNYYIIVGRGLSISKLRTTIWGIKKITFENQGKIIRLEGVYDDFRGRVDSR